MSTCPKEAPTHSLQDEESTLAIACNELEDANGQNPLSWSARKKWANIITISVISFVVPLASSMLAPAVPIIVQEFHVSSKIFPTFVVSIFVLGFASGALVLAPLSEVYGRVPIYNVTNVLFITFLIFCAVARNASMLLVARFLCGFVGVATISIGPASIADMMEKEKRGRAVSIWAVGTILGPMVGPMIGGYVTEAAGWRWMFWILAIATGVITIVACFVLRETYKPILQEREATRLRKKTNDKKYCSKTVKRESFLKLLQYNVTRPTKMLFCFPLVAMLCIYVAILYGTLYLLFATYSFVFEEIYSFSTFNAGLVFVPGAAGTLLGLFYIGCFSDRILKKRAALGNMTPEVRLSPIIILPGALLFPLGLFLYGWSAQAHFHWAIPLLGTAITGFGSILVFTAIQTYFVDAFETHAASAIGANAVLRGIAGALLPLGGLGLYDTLELGWGNAVLAFLSLTFAPVPLLVGIYGQRMRRWKIVECKL